MIKNVLDDIRSELRANANESVRVSGERFFRDGVKLYGLKNSLVHQMSRNYFRKLPDKSKSAVFTLCDQLWRSGYNEEAFIACNWSYEVRKDFEESDIRIFENWINNYITNWATCDTFCNHTVGESLSNFPTWIEELKKWSQSSNRWMKRAAAVSLIIPARKGMFLNDIFSIAENLLTDDDDMVQKGYGWMLKAASESHWLEVFEFVTRNRKSMPRTAFRYALEKMPPEKRLEAMMKK
jgi:3-methyladenine DNA glycosylase AlkD